VRHLDTVDDIGLARGPHLPIMREDSLIVGSLDKIQISP
jgi:hypothetical protein